VIRSQLTVCESCRRLTGVRGLIAIAAAAAGLAAAGTWVGPAAAAKPLPAQKQALEAVRKSLASGWLDPASAAADRSEIARAARLIRQLPSGRSEHVEVALSEVAAFSGKLTKPRAVSLFGQLRLNDDYFAKHWAPAAQTDVTDAEGVVYRYFAGRCLEFHPLANFGALNAHVAAGDAEATQRLADALIARGVHEHGGGIAWEYTFPYGGGHPPWLSGMAQAVAAQSLARAAELVPDETTALMQQARAAFQAIPGKLLTSVAAGPWIRLYSFQRLQVLNAQLQAVVSLTTYAGEAEDTEAAALAAQMARAAAATLPRFDTGYWTYYALPRDPSPLDYQQFVVQLLKKLAPDDARFADAANRIAAYEKQPPAFMLANAGVGQVRFWLSKPSSVQAVSGAGPAKRLSLGGGWHTLSWNTPKRPGIYPVHVDAVDWAGNKASFDALPIVRAASTLTKSPKKPAKRGTSSAAAGPPSFAVGAGLEDPSQLALAQQAGLRLVRLGIAWPAGSSTPDPGAVATLHGLTASIGVVVELNVVSLPADQPSLAALAVYAASLAQQVPSLRDLVLAPAPNVATAAAYAATFAAVRDAVHAVAPQLPVGVAIDGAQTPKGTVAALARSLRTGAPDLVAFRPAPAPAKNLWTTANIPQLASALAQGFGGTAPPVLIDGLATPTTIPPEEAAPYAGAPPAAGAVSPVAQGTAYADAIRAAACSPNIGGVILDRLTDNPTATPSGIYYASGDAKAGLKTVAAAVADAQRGVTVCPGLASPATASTLSFPTQLSSTTAVSLSLGCDRDCLYLVTLDDAKGSPVVAKRAALLGGAAPTTVTLPKAKLASGVYTLDVRIVGQVNPGPVTREVSPPLSVG
jgi:hypothetical protein